jgi:hypothetical protein
LAAGVAVAGALFLAGSVQEASRESSIAAIRPEKVLQTVLITKSPEF